MCFKNGYSDSGRSLRLLRLATSCNMPCVIVIKDKVACTSAYILVYVTRNVWFSKHTKRHNLRPHSEEIMW